MPQLQAFSKVCDPLTLTPMQSGMSAPQSREFLYYVVCTNERTLKARQGAAVALAQQDTNH